MGPAPPGTTDTAVSLPAQRRRQKKTAKGIELYVYHLDNDEYKFELPKSATGEDLMRAFAKKYVCSVFCVAVLCISSCVLHE